MSLIATIQSNTKLKKIVHWSLIPKYQARPRRWVQWFVNPFFHKKGKGTTICRYTRIDVLPFQNFNIGNYSTIEDFSTINNGVGAVLIGDNSRIGMGNVIIGPVTRPAAAPSVSVCFFINTKVGLTTRFFEPSPFKNP